VTILAWSAGTALGAFVATLLLRAAMRQAVTDRAIEYDPTTAGIAYPRAQRKRPVTLTGAQARALMELVKGERFAPILVVSLGLGIRRGEALGLRTQDIIWEDDDDRTMPALRTSDVPESSGRAKPGGRGIPLGPTVYAYNDFVFCDLAGAPIPVMRLRGGDTYRGGDGVRLDEAWVAAEKALGDYWRIRSLTEVKGGRWEAVATDGNRIRTAVGVDPADALCAVARQFARGAADKLEGAMG
jgi:hypothetical protein